jgi:hypothetical protein
MIGLSVVWYDSAVVFAATGGLRRGLQRMITKQQNRKCSTLIKNNATAG